MSHLLEGAKECIIIENQDSPKSPCKTYSVKNFKNLTYDGISKFFDRPILEAAQLLDVSESYLKRLCRALCIYRWPYRRIHSLQLKRDRLVRNVDSCPRQIAQKIAALDDDIAEIMKNGLQNGYAKRKKSNTTTQGVQKKRGRPLKKKIEETVITVLEWDTVNDLSPLSKQWDNLFNSVLPLTFQLDDGRTKSPIDNSPLGVRLNLDVDCIIQHLNRTEGCA
jgi:hypothetical protein